ncbi:hypothetical protein V866_007965 [Kwoniella sp. B9012]
MSIPSRARRPLASATTTNMSSRRPHTRPPSSLYIPYDGFTNSQNRTALRTMKSRADENDIGTEGIKPTLGVKGKEQQDDGSKKLGILEKKVDKNDQIIRDKISPLDNPFMELKTHVLYLLSKSPYNLTDHPSNALYDHFKSPPVPALKRNTKKRNEREALVWSMKERRRWQKSPSS